MIPSPLVQLRNLRKQQGTAFQLQVPQLDLQRSTCLALLGPTGAGKSTLLRLLAGLELPTAGSVEYLDGPSTSPSLSLEIRRKIAMVHQRPALLSGSVRSNIEYPLRLRRITGTQVTEKTNEVMERLRLTSLADQSARTLSGGQAQLVALARALVLDPALLLLDEATANLDPAHVALVEEVLQTFHREHSTTIVWATHNLFQARRVSDQTAFLWEGELIEVTDTETFYTQPSDPRSAAFVEGRMIY